ncbi:hypothetical protein [Marinimicrobium sp. C2-29]|uniref:hypothetical protein n=1 Tax=Marinimicrobium sp. C2-29 TaxID=3139825 RepID=UPI0031389FBE
MKTIRCRISIGLVAGLLASGGCAINPHSSPDFGDSVNRLHERQAYRPSTRVPPGDGEVTSRVLDSYREAASGEEDSVATEITINAGN